jgi:hypothetical protein
MGQARAKLMISGVSVLAVILTIEIEKCRQREIDTKEEADWKQKETQIVN